VSERRGLAPALLGLTLLALALRVRGLGRSIWYDEAFTLQNFTGGALEAWTHQVAANNHPLASLLAWVAKVAGAEAPLALRSPFLVLGVAAVPALTWALWPLGRRRAWLAGGLLALAPPAVLASQQVRGYAGALLFATLALGAAVRCTQEDRRRHGVILALATGLAIASHPTQGLGLGLAGLAWVALSEGSARRRLALGCGAGGVLGLLILAPTLGRTWHFVRANLGVAPAAGLHPGPLGLSSLVEALGGGWVAIPLVALALLGALRAWSLGGFERGLLAWALAPLALVVVGALGYARFLWFGWPAWVALAALGACRLRGVRGALPLLALVLAASLGVAQQGREELQDLRGGIGLVLARAADRAREGEGVPLLALGPGAELMPRPLQRLSPNPELALRTLVHLRGRAHLVLVPLPGWLSTQPALRAELARSQQYVLPGRESPVLVIEGR
jgi:hypothetical protein